MQNSDTKLNLVVFISQLVNWKERKTHLMNLINKLAHFYHIRCLTNQENL